MNRQANVPIPKATLVVSLKTGIDRKASKSIRHHGVTISLPSGLKEREETPRQGQDGALSPLPLTGRSSACWVIGENFLPSDLSGMSRAAA